MKLTRRHALAGAAALAATPLLPRVPATAAAPAADKQAPSFYRYKVGDAQVTAISDGVNNFALPDTFDDHRSPPPHYRGMGGRLRLRSSPLPPDRVPRLLPFPENAV
jgi:hypothetical protein